MFWEGFIRSLQAEIVTAVIWLVVIAIAYLVFRHFVEDQDAKRYGKLTVKVLVAVVLFFLLGRAFVMGVTNRTPRQDVDKSGVYEQMRENAK